MANIKRFHPGVYIKESLETMKMTAREFSARTGISERTLSSIINGNGDITFDVAYKLSQFFDDSISFWINLQTQYDQYLYEKELQKQSDEEYRLAKKVKKYLLDNSYINDEDSKEEKVYKCRKLAGVNSLLLLQSEDSFACLNPCSNEKDMFFQNFWIAMALSEARKKADLSYDKNFLLDSIDEIRRMTTQSFMVFYPRLNEIMSCCGIYFVLLPYLEESNIYGATKWFDSDHVMMAVSNANDKADQFWINLFYEIAHVLLQHRREMLINVKDNEDEQAESMAYEMLIPQKQWNRFVAKGCFNEESISTFALQCGIHPGIVLARMSKENIASDNTYNISYQL